MRSNPKVSVILPNYNCGQFIEKSIESIIKQSFKDFELIIIDDASNDNSLNKIDTFLYDDRVKVIKLKKNRGNYVARNSGISRALGKYIAIMDSDDIADENRLSVQYKFMEKNDYAMIGTQGYLIDTKDEVIGSIDKPTDINLLRVSFLRNNYVLHPSVFFNRMKLKACGLDTYNDQFPVASDYDFVSRTASKLRVTNIPERLIYYRVHNHQISSIKREAQVSAARKIRMSLLTALQIYPSQLETVLYNRLMENLSLRADELNVLTDFLNKVIENNSKVKIYHDETLFAFFQSLLKNSIDKKQS